MGEINMLELDDAIYGTDYSSTGEVSSTGDMSLVEGLANAKQSIHNWILTEKGTYPNIDTEYGSEIYNIQGEDFEAGQIEACIVYIANALYDNPRVSSIEQITPSVLVDGTLNFNIRVFLVNGTEEELNITL